MEKKTVVIVGAGITGVATAEFLRRDGHDVTLIDPVTPGTRGQTSYGNAGLLARTSVMPVATPSLVRKAPLMALDPKSPLFLRWSYLPRLVPWIIPFIRNANASRIREISHAQAALVFDTNDRHLELARGTGADAYITSGEFVSLHMSEADFLADALSNEIRTTHGLEPTHLSRRALLDRDPQLGPGYEFGAMYKDYAWLTSPGAYVEALFGHFQKQGGTYRQSRVVNITPGTRPCITLEGGETLMADKVVLSAGVWSSKLAKAMGIAMKLEAERGYHISMYAPSHAPPNPYMVSDGKFVVTPMAGFLRAAGVVEFAGIDAPEADAPLALIRNGMKALYPDLTFKHAETWMGRRPTTPDSLPVIGESTQAPNILHAYGGQHVGMTIGPKIGRLIADGIANRRTNMDLGPYRPDRF